MSAFLHCRRVEALSWAEAIDRVSCDVAKERSSPSSARTARENDVVQHDRGATRPTRRDHISGRADEGLRLKPAAAASRRTFQIVRPFRRSAWKTTSWSAPSTPDVARATAAARSDAPAQSVRQTRATGQSLTLPDRVKAAEVARALATAPQLLLLDEVMAGLRPTETDRMVAILRELNAQGLTILLIEHVMRAVMALAHRVLVLHHGAQIALGAPEAVTREPTVVESYLGVEAL